MLLPRKEDVLHKSWLLRLLTAVCEDSILSSRLAFKGGTCAALRGFLNRFSIDLDFDLLPSEQEIQVVEKAFEKIFDVLGLEVKDRSAKAPQYFLRYPDSNPRARNIIKIDSSFPVPKSNAYEMVSLPEVDRVMKCQTLDTLVANKLVSLIARFERTGGLAGRDLYDVHHFLMQGYPYRPQVILEQRSGSLKVFFQELIDFVEREVTSSLIDQDLNSLLPPVEFQKIRKILKQETLMLLKDEVRRIEERYRRY